MKILLVEDNEQLNKALSVILSRNSFIVDSAFDGEEALTLIDEYSTSENVWVFISYLRKKLEQIESKTKIKSIRYQGYYLDYNDDKETKN